MPTKVLVRRKPKAQPSKNLGGRPTKKTPEVITKLVAAFNNLMTDTEACSYAGISRESYYNWLEQDPMFADKMASAKAHPKMLAKETMIYAIKERKSWMAAAWLLERLEPDQYSLRQKVDVQATVLAVNLTPDNWGNLNNAINAASAALPPRAGSGLPESGRDSQSR